MTKPSLTGLGNLALAKGHSLECEGLRRQVHAIAQPIHDAILGGGAVEQLAIYFIHLFQDPGDFFIPHLGHTGTAHTEPEEERAGNKALRWTVVTVAAAPTALMRRLWGHWENVFADVWRKWLSCPLCLHCEGMYL
jgi:hypothetical protein